jgi:hypothetical protein
MAAIIGTAIVGPSVFLRRDPILGLLNGSALATELMDAAERAEGARGGAPAAGGNGSAAWRTAWWKKILLGPILFSASDG